MACVSYDGDTTAELAVGDRFVISKGSQSYKDLQASPEKAFWRYSAKKMGNYS